MQSTRIFSQDKGRAGNGAGDQAQSFASLNFSDSGHSYEPSSVLADYITQSSLSASYETADTTTVASCPVSSHEGESVAGSSDSQSRGTAASAQTVRTDVNNTINRQRPANERYQLHCEFYKITGCNTVFPGDDMRSWMEHVEGHIHSKFPRRLRCWFCSDYQFDARKTSQGDVRSNFNIRMQHIRDHIVYDGYLYEQMLVDGHLINHLLDQNIIDRRTYDNIVTPKMNDVIKAFARKQRKRRKHRSPCRVLQVDEMVADSSPRLRQETERRIFGTKGARHECGSQRVRRNREFLSEPISASAVACPDDAVSKPPQAPPRSLDSSSKLLENISSKRPSILNRNTATDHSENEIDGHAGNETVTSTVLNGLHQIRAEISSEASGGVWGRFESPQSHHSDVALSSCQTDTSTTESGSFWLVEYSEDEEQRLDEGHILFQFRDVAVVTVFAAFHSWRGDNSEQDTPFHGAEKSDHASYEGKGKGIASETGKRTRAGKSEINNENNSTDPSSTRVGSTKRRRTSNRQLTFACPYTKKDPMSYRDCYKYKLSRIRDVKQHLARCHRNPPYCPRCMVTFGTEEERDEHVRESSCPLRSLITLDGINETQRSRLGRKSAPNTSPEAQWFVVFDIVFPGHTPRPASPYVDSELLQDITLYQDFLTTQGPRLLSEVLAQRGAVTWNLPDEEHNLAAFQQTVFEDGLGVIFDHWLARRSNSFQAPNMPSSSASTGQDTPLSSSYLRGMTSMQASGVLPPESVENLPIGRPLNAPLESEGMAGSSSRPMYQASGEGWDATFNFENGDVDLLSGLPYDGSDDELMRLMMDDAPTSSGFQPGLD